MSPDTPTAVIVRTTRNQVTVICPYCSRAHTHRLFSPGEQWFAPKCGINLNPEQRARGYQFNTMEEKK